MKRTAVIVGVAIALMLGIFALAHRPGVAFAHPASVKMMGMMGHAGMPGMGPGMMGAGAAGCPMAARATATPEEQQERARVFAENYIKQFLPGYTLEKQPAGQ
jgi:hypothetical protein